MDICIFCKLAEGTMVHRTLVDGTTRKKCRDCQNMRVQAQNIRRTLRIPDEKPTGTSFNSKNHDKFDFHEASRLSIERLSKRPFYMR